MFKVFLVDDEIVIREGIRNGFPWDESEFTLCGEAPDGEMAFPMIQDLKPDILITDIRMPFMDGLALSRRVVQALPWTNIIILSGYDDFEYAQEAISIGVKQYLLKPVTPRKLGETLQAMAVKIRLEREKQADTALLRDRLASSARFAKEQVVTQFLTGSNTPSLLEEASALGMPLSARHYLVMLLGEVPADEKWRLIGALHHLVESQGTSTFCTTALESPALLLLQLDDSSDGVDDLEERAYALAQALEHEAGKNNLKVPPIAIGSPVSRLSELPQALASARAILKSIQGLPPRIAGSLDVDLSSSAELMDGDILPLYEKLLYASQKDGAKIIEEYFGSLGDRAVQSLLVLNYILMDVLLAATRIIRQCGGDPAQVLPARLMQQAELLRLCQHPDKALAAGKEIITAALSYRDLNMASRYGETLRRAKAYIEKNFHRPDLSLHDVASHVALSNNHFCTVFSQGMGVTFTEYITGIRLDRAKHLLSSTSDRTSEIAFAVGYNDPHYFSYLFKKQLGLSPREFKKQFIPEGWQV